MSDRPEPIPAAIRADNLADSVLILLALTAVQRVVGFVRVVLFCRWLDPEELGQWDLAFSFLLLAGPMSVLAMSSGLGRYVEHYRQKGQLRMLLARTGVACGALALAAAVAMCLAREPLAELVFGSRRHAWLLPLLAATLLAVVGYNYVADLLTALRQARLYAGVQLLNGVAFAVFGIGALCVWGPSAGGVVLAYAAACAISCGCGLAWLARRRQSLGSEGPPCPQREFWRRLLPFVSSVWMASVMTNLFEIAGRCMIVHYAPGNDADVLAAVGDYHSSRVVPLLLVSIAQMLSPMILPHLSQDWEQGRRRQVSVRLNLYLKLAALAMSAGSVVVLWAAPVLFNTALAGKYAHGLAVLPLTLTYCTWFGLSAIAQNFLLCAERPRLGSLALAAGLALNVGLGAVLVPRFGLQGAVAGIAAANLAALALILLFGRSLGFRIDGGTLIVLAVPAFFWFGPWTALAALLAVAMEAAGTSRIFSAEEKDVLRDGLARYRRRWTEFRARAKSGPRTAPSAPP